MSLMDNLKNIPSDLAEAIRRVEESGETVKFKKAFGGQAKVKFEIKISPSTDDLDLDDLSLEELNELLEKLEQQLSILEADEPEDEDSDEYEEWEDEVSELEDQIDQVQSAIDDYEE